MTPAEKEAAIDAGREARERGKARKANPYYLNTPQARAWFAGYDGPSLLNRVMTWVLAFAKRKERE